MLQRYYDLFESSLEETSVLDCETYYSDRYTQDWQTNIKNKVFTKTGIDNYIEKNPEYTREQVIAEIEHNPMFARMFIKDPVQQSCFQKYANEYINKYTTNVCCTNLPNAGPSALYVYNGSLCFKKDLPTNATKEVKSIDFKIIVKTKDNESLTVYASHKHTRKDGGNQSNQWYDLIHFAAHANKSKEDQTIYIALADGPYYEHTTDEGLTKLEHIRKYENDHFKAMTTTDFVKWVDSL